MGSEKKFFDSCLVAIFALVSIVLGVPRIRKDGTLVLKQLLLF